MTILNIVIAIILEAWDTARERANIFFWRFRLEYLAEMRSFLPLMSVQRRGEVLFKIIDDLPKFQIKSNNVRWTDEPYRFVTSSEQYYNPHKFFIKDVADQIKEAHSMQAELKFAQRKHSEGNDVVSATWRQFQLMLVVLKWIGLAFVYLILIVLGLAFIGVFWPEHLRHAFLAWGTRASKF